jgi:hypothetical protein
MECLSPFKSNGNLAKQDFMSSEFKIIFGRLEFNIKVGKVSIIHVKHIGCELCNNTNESIIQQYVQHKSVSRIQPW